MKHKAAPSIAYKTAYLERLLEGLSPANAGPVRTFIEAKRGEGTRVSTLVNYTVALTRWDEWSHGTDLRTLAPETARAYFAHHGDKRSPATLWGIAAGLRIYLRWCFDGEPPRDLMRSLKRRAAPRVPNIQPIEQHEFDALLAATQTARTPASRVQTQAMLWTLWDSGFRIGEMLALTVGGIELDAKGGARLRLPPPREGLKTGSRTVYVVDCVGPLKTWLALHPYGNDLTAFLFPSHHHGYREPYWPQNVNALLNRLCAAAGTRKLNPHLFRITRATRAARDGWVESQMRGYFGWSNDSDMPSHYIRLAQADMEERVRRDAGIDSSGRRANDAPLGDVAIDSKLRDALRRLLTDPDEPRKS